jgi:hypothetical protein
LAKDTEFKGKKLRDLDIGLVIDFVREVLDYKSGMTPFTEPVQKPMTLEVKDAIIGSIGSTHKWALYERADYDKLEDEEALEVLRLCVKPTSLSNFFEKLEKNTRFVLQYTPKVDKINMEVFGDFYKGYIAYKKKFEFVLAFMSKEIKGVFYVFYPVIH